MEEDTYYSAQKTQGLVNVSTGHTLGEDKGVGALAVRFHVNKSYIVDLYDLRLISRSVVLCFYK